MTTRRRLVSGAGIAATFVLSLAVRLLLPAVASAQNTATGLEEEKVAARTSGSLPASYRSQTTDGRHADRGPAGQTHGRRPHNLSI
jgi:hypothetical protein